jgi:hypothetical protein
MRPRLAREIMREAVEPISVQDIAVRALARKGVMLRAPGTMERDRKRIPQIFAD